MSFLTLTNVWAERVDVSTATKVAQNAANTLDSSILRSANDVELVYTATAQNASALRNSGSNADYYVFNIGNGNGFVIVSGDDRVRPVLGFGTSGKIDIDDMPGNLKSWLENYQQEITWAENENITSNSAKEEWQSLLAGSSSLRTSNNVLETAKWSQEDPYNRKTPAINGVQTVTGCVATAMAILLEYHKAQPVVSSTNNTYYLYDYASGSSNYETVQTTIAYDNEYDWDLMSGVDFNTPGSYNDEQANAVAEVMWHCGANVGMIYSVYESGAYSWDALVALRNVYGFNAGRFVWKSEFTWSEWIELVRNELDNGRPVFYNGYDISGAGGHAFICDGYTSDGYYHINWGWGERNEAYYNDYYLLSSLSPDGTDYDYSYGCGMMVDMYITDEDTPVTELRYSELECSSFPLTTGKDFIVSYNIINEGGTDFSGSIGVGIIDGGGEIETIIQQRDGVTLEEFHYYTNSFSFRCSLTSELADDEMIVPVYCTTGGEWQQMKGSSSAPIGIKKDGYVENEEEFAAAKVASNDLDKAFFLRNDQITGTISLYVDSNSDVYLRMNINNSSDWIGSGLEIYGGIGNSIRNPQTLSPDDNGDIWIEIPNENIDDYYVNYTLRFDASGTTLSTLEYDLSVYNSDKTESVDVASCAVYIVDAPLTWTFSPTSLEGKTGEDLQFTVSASNVSGMMSGNNTICLDIVGTAPDYLKFYSVEDGGKTEIPLYSVTYVDGNTNIASATTGYIPVQDITEGQSYTFIINSSAESDSQYSQIRLYESTVDDISILQEYAPLYYTVTADGTVTANATVESDGTRIWTTSGTLNIYSPQPAAVTVTGISGALIYQAEISSGNTQIKLPGNIYIVTVNGESTKVRIR